MVPLGLRLLTLRDTLPGWVPEALHDHHCQSPYPRSPAEPLHFPAAARGPAAALSLNRNHLTVAGHHCWCCCTHCRSSMCSKEMRSHLLPPGHWMTRSLSRMGQRKRQGTHLPSSPSLGFVPLVHVSAQCHCHPSVFRF